MDDAVWTKVVVTVTPDDAASPNPPGDGSSTADLCSWGGSNRTLLQASSVVGAAGSYSTTFTPAVSWNRETLTGSIDGADYTASVYIQDQGATGNQLRLFLEVSGGVIRVRLFSVGGSVAAHVWGWQLEQSASATAYQKREGT